MSKPVFGPCRFCHTQKKLIKSHIVPKAFLRTSGLFGSKGKKQEKMVAFGASAEGIPFRKLVGDLWEHLLCLECDNFLGKKYDEYLHDAIKRTVLPDLRKGTENPLIRIDQQRFRLGLLSILWRAAVASSEYFAQVELQSEFEEQIREMLQAGDPTPWNLFPSLISAALDDGHPQTEVLSLDRFELNGIRFNRIWMMGLIISFYPGIAPDDFLQLADAFLVRDAPNVRVFTGVDMKDTDLGITIGYMARDSEVHLRTKLARRKSQGDAPTGTPNSACGPGSPA